ncbi:hypothetical protein Adt_35543 [Abeliophyllum distichum]|uniref:Uncharacterized protein n=1 Tax=Abeliophyllum distichum TaxID=126358 RepID=A0ABD1QF20_9LAMI
MPEIIGRLMSVVEVRQMFDGGDGDAGNSSSSNSCVRISHRRSELDPSILGSLPTSPAIVVANVYNSDQGDVQYPKSFDGKLTKEEANSKKLSDELKAMSLEKAQLESEKRILQVRLDTLAIEGDELKAKYMVELTSSKECLKDARTCKRSVEAAQKSAEEAQRLAEERAFAANTVLATANSTLEALVAKKERMLAEAREDMERIKADCAELVERISEVHLEWDLSFLRHPPGEASTFVEPPVSDKDPVVSEALGPVPPSQVGP